MNRGSENDSGCSPEARSCACASARVTAIIRFRIAGPLRFLSHAETLRVFQRACTRAAVPLRYTQGFNPHPRLSLPLPRPVGVESDEELLLARLADEQGRRMLEEPAECERAMTQALAGQLPQGLELLSLTLTTSSVSPQPHSLEYVFAVRIDDNTDLRGGLEEAIARVMGSERCMIERACPDRRAARCIDVRPFLDSVRLEGTSLVVRCLTGPAGSVRIEEIMQIFALRVQDLAGPVRRTKVTWETTGMQTMQTPHREDGAEDFEDAT